MADLEELAGRFPPRVRQCADLLDSFPCVSCGARSPSQCPLSREEWEPLGELINRTPGLVNHLRRQLEPLRSRTQGNSNG